MPRATSRCLLAAASIISQPTHTAALQRTTQSHSTTGLVLPLVGRFEFMTRCQIHAAPFHVVYIPRTAALQPINFATLTRVTNNASCNWVNLLQVSSVRFGSCAVNSSIGKHVFRTPVQFSSVQFSSAGLLYVDRQVGRHTARFSSPRTYVDDVSNTRRRRRSRPDTQ